MAGNEHTSGVSYIINIYYSVINSIQIVIILLNK
jgi:hypothetical protein